MSNIVFFDTEITNDGMHLKDIGAISEDGSSIHTPNRNAFVSFVADYDYLCGHNIIAHDLKYVESDLKRNGKQYEFIDTLLLSPLLFPSRPYHHLLKDDKLQTGELNNPVNDSQKAKDLFFDEVTAFKRLDKRMQRIYCSLLHKIPEFSGFFKYLGVSPFYGAELSIKSEFRNLICSNAPLESFINDSPVELAYCLALIRTGDKYTTIAPWVARNYPKVHEIYNSLCNTPCRSDCPYCSAHFGIRQKLKEYFDYDDFRTYNGEPLQRNAVQAAVNGKSVLAVFPTGGGKSLTFQLPALISGETAHGLTVVISPLQSLMKDQVDNLNRKGIAEAATINGSLNPVERKAAIDMVENGIASILYIAPESLRSATIERLLKSRNVVRFVIDEAHCFSAWGQDFRVDYLYIGQFIKKLQEEKGLEKPIPVSCFTATAKQKVISDIREYFRVSCGVELDLFTTSADRTNLKYEVLFRENDEKKYTTLRDLILAKECPTIVYVSRTKKTVELADRLKDDGIPAVPYHGQMDTVIKKANQEEFMSGTVDVVVATTAFGMGIDKEDVGLVVHYNISTSLEDYVQEAGRAGRNPEMEAECFILFNDDDLDKHFQYLNEMKLSLSEIKQIWKAVKYLSGKRNRFTKTPLEIARAAGWEDTSTLVETKVKSSISALEQAGYLVRGKNVPRIYANGLAVHNMQEAADDIRNREHFSEKDKQLAIEIMNFLVSKRSQSRAGTDDDESRIDYIADRLGRPTNEVMYMVIRLREEGILDDSMDMSAHIDQSAKANKAMITLQRVAALENYLLDRLPDSSVTTLKELNTYANEDGVKSPSTKNLKSLILFWIRQKYIKKTVIRDEGPFSIEKKPGFDRVRDDYTHRINISKFIVNYLFRKPAATPTSTEIAFSVLELQQAYNSQLTVFNEYRNTTSMDIVKALIYLNDIEALTFDGGFFVIYNAIQVERIILDNHIQYKKEDYRNLEEYYIQRREMIHIIGKYARLMAKDYEAAMEFVRDYFAMDYMLFIRKYFSDRTEIDRSITPERYNKLFESLSPQQRRIIDDDHSQHIVVAAGPGSGKTKVLVHKLASLLLLEDVKSEQLLMLTFSRSAATEFKQRLIELIGEAAFFVDIRTFHSYCFNLLGQIGSITESEYVVPRATSMIKDGEIDVSKITKTVLVLDEAQDMNRYEFDLVEALMKQNEDMRVIAVGDDDQNIYEFRGSDSKYLKKLIEDYGATQYELLDNYRSDKSIIDFANQFVTDLKNRMKTSPINAVSNDTGYVQITKYASGNLAIPTLDLITQKYRGGTCCVMTATNKEALLMTGILNKNGLKAKLIQSNDGFNLLNLYEIRCFMAMLGDQDDQPIIQQDVWDKAINSFSKRFENSTCLQECLNILNSFDEINKEKYYSDFKEYIQESNLEDFTNETKDTILVSTIHKTKGREFDSVYMMLNNYRLNDDAARRVIYVGITRAQKALYINCNNSVLDRYSAAVSQGILRDNNTYPEPDEALLQLTHKGVNLGYFKYLDKGLVDYQCGQALIEKNGDLYTEPSAGGKCLARLSKSSYETITALCNKGFEIYKAEVRFMVYWKGKTEEEEVLCVLPDIHLRKKGGSRSSRVRRSDSVEVQSSSVQIGSGSIQKDSAKPSDGLSEEELILFRRIKKLRDHIAEELEIDEYRVVTYKTMIDMALRMPTTREEFSKVDGIRTRELKQFGDRFIDEIRKYKKESNKEATYKKHIQSGSQADRSKEKTAFIADHEKLQNQGHI